MATSGDMVSSSGPYTDVGPTEIRIVEIQPGDFDDPIQLKLKVVGIEDGPVYDALSYVSKLTAGSVKELTPLKKAKVVANKTFFMPLGADLEAAIRQQRLKGSTSSAIQVL